MFSWDSRGSREATEIQGLPRVHLLAHAAPLDAAGTGSIRAHRNPTVTKTALANTFLRSLRLDPYLLALVATVTAAALVPATGATQALLDRIVYCVIAALFFLYGARLSPSQVWSGLTHWRLQAIVLAATYVVFPAIGVLAALLLQPVLDPTLAMGIAFLSILPSTIQSSIGFTSAARGNLAAALSSASISNVLGIAVTPLLAAALLSSGTHGTPTNAIKDIALQLLLPFVLGQALRPLVANPLVRWRSALASFDRGCILLVVYAAFSAGVAAGIWQRVAPLDLAAIVVANAVILTLVLWSTRRCSRALRFDVEDEIAVVFCGSKKSMATGIPMANVLLPATSVALAIVPLLIFHQMQLFVCAVLAKRYAARAQHPDAAMR